MKCPPPHRKSGEHRIPPENWTLVTPLPQCTQNTQLEVKDPQVMISVHFYPIQQMDEAQIFARKMAYKRTQLGA